MKRTWLSSTVVLATALAACGQKGPLYLPEKPGEVVTRPTQTPAPAPESTTNEPVSTPNTPQTVDSPEGKASPAPEVVVPSPTESEKKKQDAARPR